MLALSGVGGLLLPAIGIVVLVALGKWFWKEPMKASRLTLGGLVMFASIFVPAIVGHFLDFNLMETPLLFLASVLASVYCGVKLAHWIWGRYGDETS